MSDVDELRAEVATLRAELAEVRRQLAMTGRLGPRPETQEGMMRTFDDIKPSAPVLAAETPKLCTTNGEPVEKVRREQTNETGQHKGYIVLCEEERRKGFVRPYRD